MPDQERPSFDEYLLSRQVGVREAERTIEARFWAFHRAHPEVYAELRRRALLARERGFAFGIRTLWEAMRWDWAMAKDAGAAYKLNDHFTSRYARLLMDTEPELCGMFETREIRSA